MHLKKYSIVNCPQCGEIVEWKESSRYRPFCSARCKTLDLGQWAASSYRIPDADTSEENNQEKLN